MKGGIRKMIVGILQVISFVCLILAPAAVEGENYILALVLILVMGLSAYGAMREEGHIKKK